MRRQAAFYVEISPSPRTGEDIVLIFVPSLSLSLSLFLASALEFSIWCFANFVQTLKLKTRKKPLRNSDCSKTTRQTTNSVCFGVTKSADEEAILASVEREQSHAISTTWKDLVSIGIQQLPSRENTPASGKSQDDTTQPIRLQVVSVKTTNRKKLVCLSVCRQTSTESSAERLNACQQSHFSEGSYQFATCKSGFNIRLSFLCFRLR